MELTKEERELFQLHDKNLSESPSWHVVDNKYITYVKTIDCKVTGVMLPVAQAIQEMFDSGVQFVDPTRIPNQE